ncbi:MAG: type II secretion system F family protein [Paracoccaceae bacterium]
MLEYIQDLSQSYGVTNDMLLLSGVAIGTLILFYGVVGAFKRDPTGRRMQPGGRTAIRDATDSLFHEEDGKPTGVLKAFVPSSRQERTKIAKKMRQAGAHSKNAVRNFYVFRTLLGLILPGIFIALTLLPEGIVLPFRIERFVSGLNSIQTFQIMTLLIIVGFFGPSIWLNRRIKIRRKKIENALPNALDLLLVAIEAGMGFDAATSRVAHEMYAVAPAISEEFRILQLEIQAGKERHTAFLDMSARTGVTEFAEFANVINQSVQFGTSISDSLLFFSEKMREDREMRAQEMANKLPVKMSGVMAALMMPTLLLITLAPVAIRWMSSM